jgi:hypothetical protein
MMEKRDLKADLEQIQNFRSKWRQSTSLEEAWDIGVAWEYFWREKAELWLDQALAEKERADKAEALARELVEALKKATVRYLGGGLEADLSAFLSAKRLLERAKEVLGDE